MDKPRQVSPGDVEAAISSLKRRLDESGCNGGPQRIDCSPENIEQGLARLVLSLMELLHRLLERQAIRRMEGGSLSEQEMEDMGVALMKLEAKIRELAGHFGLTMADLNLELGPLGNLLER
jgi:hypothetical protein